MPFSLPLVTSQDPVVGISPDHNMQLKISVADIIKEYWLEERDLARAFNRIARDQPQRVNSLTDLQERYNFAFAQRVKWQAVLDKIT